MPRNKCIFISATDTGVGKTVATAVLGTLLAQKGFSVGVLKPAQCAGNDAQLLKKILSLKEDLSSINPFFAPEPLSPHLAFKRAGIAFNSNLIKECVHELKKQHDWVLIEGAGGLMVPLADNYYNADLIKDLKAELLLVTRLGLGSINHTLLTINEAKRRNIKIKGLIFSQSKASLDNIPEKTNPQEIERLSGVSVLGIIPYLKPLTQENILRQCQHLQHVP